MLVVALSVVGCDQTWNSPFRVLTCLIGAISRAARGFTRLSSSTTTA
jgi:hypothetical protein